MRILQRQIWLSNCLVDSHPDVCSQIVDIRNIWLNKNNKHPKMSQQKYIQYSRRGFLNKINPQFIGIARTVQTHKRQRLRIEKQKTHMDHQVSYMEKINQKLQQSLHKRKSQLKQVRSIRSRYLSQLKKKQMLDDHRDKELQRLKDLNLEHKELGKAKREKAKEICFLSKKMQTVSLKNYLSLTKQDELTRKTREHNMKKSRVALISDQKTRMTQNYNKFHQDRNRQFLNNYLTTVKKQSRTSSRYKSEMKDLQSRLIELREVAEKKKANIQKLNESIDSIQRENSASSFRSRTKNFVSTRSRSKSPSQQLLTRKIIDDDKKRFSQFMIT